MRELANTNIEPISLDSTLDEKSWWILDNLSPEDLVKVKFSSWQNCHYNYFFHHLLFYKEEISQIIELMTRTPCEAFSYRPSDTLYGHRVEFIDSYFDLMVITQDLHVCTAGRGDLIEGFLNGNHLRWRIVSPEGKIVGVGTIQNKNGSFDKKKSFNGKDFEVYALGYRHTYLENSKSIEGKVFWKFIDLHGAKIAKSLKG